MRLEGVTFIYSSAVPRGPLHPEVNNVGGGREKERHEGGRRRVEELSPL